MGAFSFSATSSQHQPDRAGPPPGTVGRVAARSPDCSWLGRGIAVAGAFGAEAQQPVLDKAAFVEGPLAFGFQQIIAMVGAHPRRAERAHQLFLGEQRIDEMPPPQGDAQPVHRRLHRQRVGIEEGLLPQVIGIDAEFLQPGAPVHPFAMAGGHLDQIEPVHLFGVAGRRVGLQIARRADRKHGFAEQHPCLEAGPVAVASQDRQIDAVGEAFIVIVRRNEHDLQMLVLTIELLQSRHQPQPRDRVGGGKRHGPVAVIGGGFLRGVAQHLQGRLDARQKQDALGRDADRAVAAQEELQAIVQFQQPDLAADRGLADVEPLRGGHEAVRFRRCLEGKQVIERRQGDRIAGHACKFVPFHFAFHPDFGPSACAFRIFSIVPQRFACCQQFLGAKKAKNLCSDSPASRQYAPQAGQHDPVTDIANAREHS